MKSRLDPYLALVVAVAQVVVGQGAAWGQRFTRAPLDPYSYALLLVGPAMILVRRRYPISSTLVTLVATALFVVGGYPYGPIFLSPGIMLFWLVVIGRRKAAWIMAGSLLVFFEGYAWAVGNRDLFHALGITTFMLLLMVMAELVRILRERRAERVRAEEEEARRQASEERLTMAQELHDVLAHNISLIHVQASTALHLIDEHPEQARSALATIKTASRRCSARCARCCRCCARAPRALPRPAWTTSTASSSAPASTSRSSAWARAR